MVATSICAVRGGSALTDSTKTRLYADTTISTSRRSPNLTASLHFFRLARRYDIAMRHGSRLVQLPTPPGRSSTARARDLSLPSARALEFTRAATGGVTPRDFGNENTPRAS